MAKFASLMNCSNVDKLTDFIFNPNDVRKDNEDKSNYSKENNLEKVSNNKSEPALPEMPQVSRTTTNFIS